MWLAKKANGQIDEFFTEEEARKFAGPRGKIHEVTKEDSDRLDAINGVFGLTEEQATTRWYRGVSWDGLG